MGGVTNHRVGDDSRFSSFTWAASFGSEEGK